MALLQGASGDGITDQFMFLNGKMVRGLQEEQQQTENTALRRSLNNVNQFTPTTIHLEVRGRFDRNCVNIDNTEAPIATEQSLLEMA